MSIINNVNDNPSEPEIDILSLAKEKDSPYLQNYPALKPLQVERDWLIRSSQISGGSTLAGTFLSGGTIIPLLLLVSTAIAYLSLEYLTRVSRLCTTMELLLGHFGDEGITITPRVKTQDGIIDLLVKMPDKRAFVLMLRSKGDTLLHWDEGKQDFFAITKKNGKAKKSRWSNLISDSNKLDRVFMALKKDKNPLIGSSNAERNRPVVKVIVLAGSTKLDQRNDKSLFVKFGQTDDLQVLRVHTGVVTYVVNQDNLIKFLEKPEE